MTCNVVRHFTSRASKVTVSSIESWDYRNLDVNLLELLVYDAMAITVKLYFLLFCWICRGK